MRLAYPTAPVFRPGLEWRLVYAFFLPLFVAFGGASNLLARYASDEGEPRRARGPWVAEARSQASIATSYALMAKSMLQSSQRRPRPKRLSRL
jgi:hypothetical protein